MPCLEFLAKFFPVITRPSGHIVVPVNPCNNHVQPSKSTLFLFIGPVHDVEAVERVNRGEGDRQGDRDGAHDDVAQKLQGKLVQYTLLYFKEMNMFPHNWKLHGVFNVQVLRTWSIQIRFLKAPDLIWEPQDVRGKRSRAKSKVGALGDLTQYCVIESP